jgi:hypothetical protein
MPQPSTIIRLTGQAVCLCLQDLLCKLAAPELVRGLYLYTTPPKTLLKDAAANLYCLQLVPAAHIHVGFDEKKAQGVATPAGAC